MLFSAFLLALVVQLYGGSRIDQPITFSCDDVVCPDGLVCVYGQTGPTCEKAGTCPAMRLDVVAFCARECRCDTDCKEDDKCCFNGCTQRCFKPIPDPIITCRAMKCLPGYECKDYPTGGQCEVVARPGDCPALPCRRVRPTCKDGEDNEDECTLDTDCLEKNSKCCKQCDGCRRCVKRSAPTSCRSMFCAVKSACVEEKRGPKCVKDRPKRGHCPLTTCSTPPDKVMCSKQSACVSDVQCPDNLKCCKGCDGCGVCTKPPRPPSCDDKECREDQTCVMKWIPCNTPPCPLEPKCTKPCLLPMDPGMCVGTVNSFYYDVATRKCTRFNYGGCGGNNNRFATMRECLKACSRNVQCPEGGPKPPCVKMNECSTSARGKRPLCSDGKSCCPTRCGTRCRTPIY